jgi:hypothetical protein
MSTSPGVSGDDVMTSNPVTSVQTTSGVPTFATKNLGPNPVATQRILGLATAHWSWGKIVDLGRYQGTWTEADVQWVLDTASTSAPSARKPSCGTASASYSPSPPAVSAP